MPFPMIKLSFFIIKASSTNRSSFFTYNDKIDRIPTDSKSYYNGTQMKRLIINVAAQSSQELDKK